MKVHFFSKQPEVLIKIDKLKSAFNPVDLACIKAAGRLEVVSDLTLSAVHDVRFNNIETQYSNRNRQHANNDEHGQKDSTFQCPYMHSLCLFAFLGRLNAISMKHSHHNNVFLNKNYLLCLYCSMLFII
jgi:hypothetical protein